MEFQESKRQARSTTKRENDNCIATDNERMHFYSVKTVVKPYHLHW